MISFGRDICRDLGASAGREWIETNGLGGFASSTMCGMNTRRYHGLLTAAITPPVGRVVLLSKLEETLVVGGERFDLSTNEYEGGVLHPRGFESMTQFRLDPWPVFVFECAGAHLEKSVFMVHESDTTVVIYRALELPPIDVCLELRPLVAVRDYHSTTHENGALDRRVSASPGLLRLQPYSGMPALYLAHDANEYAQQGYWYRRFFFRVEQERGLDSVEDLFNPVVLSAHLGRQRSATVIASTEAHSVGDAADFESNERQRRSRVIANSPADNVARTLAASADQYIVRRGSGHTVIAGYPWFTDWGRDTMIALPGLTLATGRYSIAREILATFAEHLDRGMLPNRFPEGNEGAEYNTVDATLWFFEAVRAYAEHTDDFAFIDEIYPALASSIDWHIRGTRFGIRMLDTGLLHSGVDGVQLTWMDAKIGDWVVTARTGSAVEIQALWYNALQSMQWLASKLGLSADAQRFANIATLTRLSFNHSFWNSELQCLYDVVNGVSDASVRPNQLIATSLYFPLVSGERATSILSRIDRELLTPRGLRTLSPTSPKYSGRYEGGPQARDAVYHQGTVWPWLLGPYVFACLKHQTGAARDRAQHALQNIEPHLTEAGVGHISEIFDGDEPHTPRGCFAQAWSVAEVMRAITQLEKAEATLANSSTSRVA